nr:LysM peptidoglycan-binding domain-containing protein [Actinomycetales bacterium]
MSALPITLSPAAPRPPLRHLRVVADSEVAQAGAEQRTGELALAATQRWSERSFVAARATTERIHVTQAPLILTARGRLAVRMLVGLVAAVVAIAAGAALGLALRSEPVAGGTVVVGAGDTLWSIAAAVPGADVRGTVAEIVSLNGLANATIQPGQVLVVPAER